MYRQDYILRLIEQFGKALIALRNRILRRDVDRQKVTAEIAEVARQAGLDLGVARSLDLPSLMMWLAPAGQVDQPRLWLMAELLYLEGLGALESGDAVGSRADLTRALAILDRLPAWRPADDLPSASSLAGEIRDLLQRT